MRSRAKLAVIVRAVPVLSIVGMVGCTSPGISSAPMAAASESRERMPEKVSASLASFH